MNERVECYDGARSIPWHESEFIRVHDWRLVYTTIPQGRITDVHLPGGERLSLQDLRRRFGKSNIRLPLLIRNSHAEV